jgi:hypothetical protein
VVDGHSGAVVAFLRQAAAAWLLQRMGMDNLEECGQMLLDWVGVVYVLSFHMCLCILSTTRDVSSYALSFLPINAHVYYVCSL